MNNNDGLELKLKANADVVNNALNRMEKILSTISKSIMNMNSALEKLNINSIKIDSSTNQAINSTKKYNKETQKLSASTNNLNKALKATGLFAYIRALKSGTNTLLGWISKSIDYIETSNKFNVSMGNMTSSAVNFQNKLSEAFGTSKTDMMDFQSTFNNIMQSVTGLSEETAYKVSESLVLLGMDYASLFNVSQNASMEKVQAALVGNVKSIRTTSGFDITDATIANLAKELGSEKSIRNMSQIEKRLLRIISLMNQMKNIGAFGDMARTIEQPANQLRVMKAQLQEIGVWLGNVFIGTFGKILPYINGFLMALKEIIKTFAIFVGYTNEISADPIQIEEDGSNLNKNMAGASASAKELKRTLMGFDVLNVIQTPSKASGVGGIGEIDPAILGALKEYDGMLENVSMKATKIRDKIMDWLGFTKYVNDETGEINWELRDGYTNLEKIWDILKVVATIFAATTIYKVVKSISGLFKIAGSSGVGKFVKGLASYIPAIAKGGESATIAFHALKIQLASILKILAPIATIIAGIKLTSAGMGMTENIWDSIEAGENGAGVFAGSAVSSLTTAGGMAAIGAGIGTFIPGIGTAIGALVGATVGGIITIKQNLEELDKLVDKLARKDIFGDISLSVNDWINVFKSAGGTMSDFKAKAEEVRSTLDSLQTSFDTSYTSASRGNTLVGFLNVELTQEKIDSIVKSVQNMVDTTSQMIDTNTNHWFDVWSETFENTTLFTTNEQKNILSSITEYGNKQKEELKKSQNNITKTYKAAISTRGYLTDEEYKYIEEQLKKIKALTESQMSASNTDLIYLKEQFNKKSLKLDEQSYSNFIEARNKYQKEQLELISSNYNEQYNINEQMHKQGLMDEQTYNETKAKLAADRADKEKAIAELIVEYNNLMKNQIVQKYIELETETGRVADKEREILEQMFANLNLDIDLSDAINDVKGAGKDAGIGFKTNLNDILKDYGPKITINVDANTNNANSKIQAVFDKIKQNSGNPLISMYTNGISAADLFFDNGKIKQYDTGGLPETGQLFYAREAGPELVGRIGNSSAVVNNEQIVEAVSTGVAQAVSSVLGGRSGSYNFYLDGTQITGVVQERNDNLANVFG